MLMPVLTATITVSAIALTAGFILSVAARRLPADRDTVVERVNELLPQTQCGQCGFAGCRPYAEAIVRGNVALNLCPPGGAETVARLAELLGRDVSDLARPAPYVDRVALIDESLCIGCTHCRDACPVDAIAGAHQYLHTVIAAECTGCELCLPPCPVDCIAMVARA